ncbi:MSHA biogenesis protein MshI [Neptunomonas antarctica]|uniref:MSHA biogenesis protein MshI n=1 Tax=Neptunomonas antarctica TaxID=619304 RepID=A0A1N7MNZ9_9GAMM|nr:MSHA biogenesis protein MshI [Neptunomonas antarctica]
MLPFRKKNNKSKELVAIHIAPEGVAIASASVVAGLRKLSYVAFLDVSEPLNNASLVASEVSEVGLSDSCCSLVLSTGEYQLLLVEAPEVPKDELKEALIWRVKDLIQYSTDDVIIDFFELPDDAFRGRRKMLYVVAADRKLIEKRISWLESIKLTPVYIDVPEIALLNIAENLSESEAGTVILYLDEKQSIVNMMSGSWLYLSRALSYSHSAQLDNTVLDLQRSMDYFESQIGKSACTRIIVLPLQIGETPLMMELRRNLDADVQSLDLGDVIESDVPLAIDLQQRCFLAIAAALRNEAGA